MPDTVDRSPHLLVLADIWCRVEGLCDEVVHRARDASRVLVVAPALASRLHTWTNDTDRESEIAQARLENVLARLEQQGVRAEGRIADQDPALAVEDALDGFAATEVVVVTEDHEHANWSERGLTARIARPGLAVQGHRADDLVVARAWCDRVRLGTDWVAAEDAIRLLRTYENENLPSLTHTICETCLEGFERRRRTATTAAHRST